MTIQQILLKQEKQKNQNQPINKKYQPNNKNLKLWKIYEK